MFRREIDGREHPFRVVGLWGSGNVIAERDLLVDGTWTAFSMWDGHALFGPARPGALERFPSLYGTISLAEFVERFGSLDECLVWSGDEELGLDCPAVCANLALACPELGATCADECPAWPRGVSECAAELQVCDQAVLCGLQAPS